MSEYDSGDAPAGSHARRPSAALDQLSIEGVSLALDSQRLCVYVRSVLDLEVPLQQITRLTAVPIAASFRLNLDLAGDDPRGVAPTNVEIWIQAPPKEYERVNGFAQALIDRWRVARRAAHEESDRPSGGPRPWDPPFPTARIYRSDEAVPVGLADPLMEEFAFATGEGIERFGGGVGPVARLEPIPASPVEPPRPVAGPSLLPPSTDWIRLEPLADTRLLARGELLVDGSL